MGGEELALLRHLVEGQDVDEAGVHGGVGAGEPEDVLEGLPGLASSHGGVDGERHCALYGGVDEVAEVQERRRREGGQDLGDVGGIEGQFDFNLCVGVRKPFEQVVRIGLLQALRAIPRGSAFGEIDMPFGASVRRVTGGGLLHPERLVGENGRSARRGIVGKGQWPQLAGGELFFLLLVMETAGQHP